jgi:hypothetical protein
MDVPPKGKVAKTVVVADPARSMPIGSTLKLRNLKLKLRKGVTFAHVENWDAMRGALTIVGFATATTMTNQGSAVIVAPGVALAASHVIEPYLPSAMEKGLTPTCMGITSKGIQFWLIRYVTPVPGSDLCILGLELASELKSGASLWKVALRRSVPTIGEKLTMCGFVASAPEFYKVHDTWTLGARLYVSSGTVSQHFLHGRGSAMPGPVLEVSGHTERGMSGGLVLDSKSRLVGLICRGLEDELKEGPTWVSHLGPALTWPFKSDWPYAFGTNSGPHLLNHMPSLCTIVP